jgi:hypothetical protein
MNPPLVSSNENQLTDVLGLRLCGVFPVGKELSVRTLRSCTEFLITVSDILFVMIPRKSWCTSAQN